MATILLIEDDEAVRVTFEIILASDGHDVVVAEDGNAGLKIAGSQRFDLVITDIIMPERDGVEVINALRKAQADLPVIAVSGGGRSSSMDYLGIAKMLGAAAVLAKPIGSTELLAAVKEALPTS
ncbi:response regulator [Thalassobius sp. MITS945101]|uniref:response regulator n=1 Tax=Thalassobius sp. MITS945101 TaxID=3096994 RepID=UPI00399B6C89